MIKHNGKLAVIILMTVILCSFGVIIPGKVYAESSGNVDALSYKMNLRLDDKNNSLSESVIIRFRNNTDSTLRKICLRDMTPAVLKYDMKYYPEDNKNLETKITSVTLKGSSDKLKLSYRKAVTGMDNTNIEYLLNIFKELTTELPKELIYRETDDFFELKSLDAA